MLELWEWLLIGGAAFLTGLSKTGVAGISVLSVAIFASVLPARESLGAVLVMLIAADVVAVTTYRRDARWSYLLRLFPWTAIGVVLGTLTLGRIDDAGVRRLIGAILVGLIVLHVLRRRSRAGAESPDEAQPALPAWLVRCTGVLAGFTTMVANAAGPIMILYLLALRLPKFAFIGTAAWFFLVINLFKVPFSYSVGLITASSLAVSLRLIPFALAGALFGRRLLVHIDQRMFEWLALALTFLAGLRLLT